MDWAAQCFVCGEWFDDPEDVTTYCLYVTEGRTRKEILCLGCAATIMAPSPESPQPDTV